MSRPRDLRNAFYFMAGIANFPMYPVILNAR